MSIRVVSGLGISIGPRVIYGINKDGSERTYQQEQLQNEQQRLKTQLVSLRQEIDAISQLIGL